MIYETVIYRTIVTKAFCSKCKDADMLKLEKEEYSKTEFGPHTYFYECSNCKKVDCAHDIYPHTDTVRITA